METKALTHTVLSPETVTVQRQVGQQEDEAPSRKRQRPESGALRTLPEDRITLSRSSQQEQQTDRSQPVSTREKAALLGPQNVPRFSVYG